MHALKNRENRWLILSIALSLLIPCIIILILGADRSWDLANYHLYNPHALFSGRYVIDIAPAQLQSWHNPALDIPLYWMVRLDFPTLIITLLLALPVSVLLISSAVLARNAIPGGVSARELVVLLPLCAIGSALLPIVGMSSGDAVVAAGMVGALALALHDGSRGKHWFWAGLVAGATAGLKLTAAPYCIALAVAAVVFNPRHSPYRLAILAIGGVCGFAVTFGPWGAWLWTAHHNPVFPYFNGIFQSPDYPAFSITDDRFKARTLADIALAPFNLLKTSKRFSEYSAAETHLALGCVAVAALAWPLGKALLKRPSAPNPLAALCAFFVVSVALWAQQSGILRYICVLEPVAAILALSALRSMFSCRTTIAASIVLVIVSICMSHYPNWARRPFSQHFLAADWPNLPANSLILTASGEPLGFFALGIRGDIPIIATRNNLISPDRCGGLQSAIERRIRDHRGPIWLLESQATKPDSVGRTILRNVYGLQPSESCTRIRSTFGPIRLCPVARAEGATVMECSAANTLLGPVDMNGESRP